MARGKKQVVVQVRPAKKKKRTTKAKAAVTAKEVGLLGTALRSLGGLAGGAIGGYFGNPIMGGAAGTGLGASISRWLGAGDYNVSQNSIVNSMKASGNIPSMHLNDQTIVVRHKEFVCEVLSNTTFTVNRSLVINPGNRSTFPWLTGIANNYQQYRIRGMVYHYIPTSGSLSSGTSNALGSVMLQTSYRSSDTPPDSKVELLNEYWSSESVPSEPFCHPIECNPGENPFNIQYVRSTDVPVPAGDSPLLYDLGTTHLATSGQQAAGIALGDLWVTYEVELKKPIVASNSTTGDFIYGAAGFVTASFTNPFATATFPSGNMAWTTGPTRTIVMPASSYGTYWIMVRFASAGTFTNGTFTGATTISPAGAATTEGFQAFMPLADYGTAVTGTSPDLYYMTRVRKVQRETSATLTLPLATVTLGTLSSVQITVWGSPEL